VALLTSPPDLLIAPDARLVGWRAPAGLSLRAARGGDAYVQAAWQQYLGLPLAPQPMCDPGGCRIELRRVPVRIGTAQAPCDTPVLLVQTGEAPYCPGALEIDRGTVWRNGAVAVWLGPTPRMLTDRQERGRRPWVFLPPEQQRASIELPFAKSDDR
jgi:competence protein ComEC